MLLLQDRRSKKYFDTEGQHQVPAETGEVILSTEPGHEAQMGAHVCRDGNGSQEGPVYR